MHQAGIKRRRVALGTNTLLRVADCVPVVMLHGSGCRGVDASPRSGTAGGHLFKISFFCAPLPWLQLLQNIYIFFPKNVLEKILCNEMLWGM